MGYLNTILAKRFFNSVCYFTLFGVFIVSLSGCSSATDGKATQAIITLSKDSQQVVVHKLDYAILHDLKADSLTAQNWAAIFAVYHMPADTDMKDFVKEQPGKYTITDSLIVFTPDTPFAKHQQYYARFYKQFLQKGQLVQSKADLSGPKFQEVSFNF